jgi:threonine synthase
MTIFCTQCGFEPGIRSVPYRCPNCGGYFDYRSEYKFELNSIDIHQPGIWRYRTSFELPEDLVPVSLGEGNTPLIWDKVRGREVAFKLDYINPTGSYKDRGTTVLLSYLSWLGVKRAVEDSSGNAGASFAAYSSRAGIHGKVYVPEYASGPKRKQIEAYGCELVPVSGPRSHASSAVKNEADDGVIYASHVYQPFVLPGYATAAYEIFEQLGAVPGSVIVPAGQGSFLLGIARGFEALYESGITTAIPQMIAVQSQACAPLWAAFKNEAKANHSLQEGVTVAEGIRILEPLRKQQVLEQVLSSGGWASAVGEGDILPARNELAMRGLYVEPTSAVVWPALLENFDQLEDPIVVVLTGSGLKYDKE